MPTTMGVSITIACQLHPWAALSNFTLNQVDEQRLVNIQQMDSISKRQKSITERT
jgi:hypothetical protein